MYFERLDCLKIDGKINVPKKFQTFHLIGWQHSYQAIRSHAKKDKLTNDDFQEILPQNQLTFRVGPVKSLEHSGNNPLIFTLHHVFN